MLCPQLRLRSIGRHQPFQLPLYEHNEDDASALLRHLQALPWNLTASRVRDGWLEVDHPQPYCQAELEAAFYCDNTPSVSM